MRPVVGIACDESGFVGGSLFGGIRVFAHASVRIGSAEAANLIREVRRRTDAGDHELKASRLNRPWALDVARWLCAADGPLGGRAAVHATDTRLFGLARLAQVATLDAPPPGWWSADRDPVPWDLALRLHRALDTVALADQRRFLAAARDLLWLTRRARLRAVPPSWPGVVAAAGTGAAAFLGSRPALDRLDAYIASTPAVPISEPLLPAFAWAVGYWSAVGDPDVVHDEQSVLTPSRVATIGAELAATHPGRRLAGFARVDSRRDPRVQVADLVAGVVRRTLADRLHGRAGDGAVPIDHLLAEGSVLVPGTVAA